MRVPHPMRAWAPNGYDVVEYKTGHGLLADWPMEDEPRPRRRRAKRYGDDVRTATIAEVGEKEGK